MANILSKTLNSSPTSDDIAYIVNDPGGTPEDNRAALGNIITKAHGLSDSTVVGVASGVLTSGVDVAVVDGGTGASTDSGARSNLGLVIGTDVQAHDAQLDDIAGLTPGKGKVLASDATNLGLLAAGTDGQLLTADAASTLGVKWSTPAGAGDASTNTATSVDSEVVVFSGTSGKLLKRATGSGIAKLTSGVLSTATSSTDYAPATSGSGILKGDGSGGFNTASAGTDYYNPGGTDVAITDGGTGASTKAGGFDALSPMSASGDIIYGGASGTGTRLVKGSDGNVLTLASGVPSWAAAASGGQTLVTRVVAPSGGDHTTLGAAITAASNGDTIYVRAGTYVESAISTALTNLHIIGENPATTIIGFSTNNAVFSGVSVKIANCGFTQTTGSFTLSGSGSEFVANRLARSNAGTTIFSADKQRILGNSLVDSDTTNHSSLTFSGTGKVINDNYIEAAPSGTSSVGFSMSYSTFSGNYVKSLSTGGNQLLDIGGNNISMCGNIISNVGNANGVMVRMNGATFITFSGNTVIDGNSLMDMRGGTNNCAVANNIFQRTVTTSSNKMFSIASDTLRNQITGNLLYEFNTTGDVLFSNAYVATAHRGNVVTGNRFVRDATGSVGVVSMGSGIFSGNLCYTGGSVNSAFTGSYCTITGNHFYSASGADVTLSANYMTITSNTFSNYPTSTGITFGSQIGIMAVDNGLPESLNKVVQKYKNTSGSTINAGDVVIIKSVAAGNEVTTTTTAGDTKLWGVSEESIANNATGFILREGKTTLLKADGTTDIAIGDYLTAFTTAGISQKATAGQLSIAIALEAFTTDASTGVLDALVISPRVA